MTYKLFDAKALLESDTFAPKIRYTVQGQNEYGEWHKWPSNDRPQRFIDLDRAKHMLNAAFPTEEVLDRFIARETTVFFSDLETQDVFSLTEYVALLV